ncbi:MAG TPA: OmpA family protein [Novosphingobium sp.]|nr:OmpA family protein [Novosphingobium sp.]
MKFKYLIAASAMVLPASVAAQAGPVAEKSAAEITCELTADCDAFNQELATRAADPERGFNLVLPGRSNAARPANAAVAPRPSASTQPTTAYGVSRQPGQAAPQQSAVGATRAQPARIAQPSVRAAVQPGRSNLSIGFASGSSTFTPAGLAQARTLLDALKQPAAAGKRFVVAGHTDSVGSRELNLELSRRRADALVAFLVENGVEASRLEARGYGFDQPLPGLSARHGANRRVEIVRVD